MLVNLDDEAISKLVSDALGEWLEDMNTPSTVPMFSYDKKLEKHYTKKLKKALRIVHAYSTVGTDLEGVIDGNN